MPRKARFAMWSLLLVAVALGIGPGPILAPPAAALEIGKPAPDFSLPNEKGETVTLRQFRGKKIVLLEFFGAAFAPT